MNARIIEFDIDDTLTTSSDLNFDDKAGSYIYRKPDEKMIKLVKQAHQQGWTVIIHTGRREPQRLITESWLEQHNIPYHFLHMNKPLCTYRIDDVNISSSGFKDIIDKEIWE